MPIPFSQLPEQIRTSIIQKQDFFDFAQFHQCSRPSYDMSLRVKTKFSFVLEDNATVKYLNEETFYFSFVSSKMNHHFIIEENLENEPVQIIFRKVTVNGLTGKTCDWLSNFLLSTGSSFNHLHIDDDIDCSPDQLNSVISNGKITELSCWSDLPSTFLQIPAMNTINYLQANSPNLTDDDLLRSKIKTMHLMDTTISAAAINTILMEWINGERVINHLSLSVAQGAQVNDLLQGLQGLPYTTVKPRNEKIRYHLQNDEDQFIRIIFYSDIPLVEISRMD